MKLKLSDKINISLGKSAIFSFNKRIYIDLKWIIDADLELCAFFKTKDGKEGGIFSNEYRQEKNDLGSVDKFPFMYISADDAPYRDGEPYRETIRISNLEQIESLYFLILNYDAAVENNPINFSDFKFCIELITDDGSNIEISEINCIDKGVVYLVGRIFHNDNSYELTNDGQVMNLARAVLEIPGFKLITS
jgi:uncharacterized protein involved in tellurium resistance